MESEKGMSDKYSDQPKRNRTELDIEALTLAKSMLASLLRTISAGEEQKARCIVTLSTAMLIRHIVEALNAYDVKMKNVSADKYSIVISFKEK